MSASPDTKPAWLRRVRVIRGLIGVCHLLLEEDGRSAIMIDTGLAGEGWQIRRALRRWGLASHDVRAILLTHGHLDHTGNLAWLDECTGAKIFAHPNEQAHIDGRYPYAGINRWCGRLEKLGRFVLRCGRPAKIDCVIADGDELPFWGGLRVVHLPGHTLGHCGFFSARHDLLFCGDLFDSYFFHTGLSPRILDSAPDLIPASLEKARRLNARYLLPQHYDFLDPALHRRRFERMMARRTAS